MRRTCFPDKLLGYLIIALRLGLGLVICQGGPSHRGYLCVSSVILSFTPDLLVRIVHGEQLGYAYRGRDVGVLDHVLVVSFLCGQRLTRGAGLLHSGSNYNESGKMIQ